MFTFPNYYQQSRNLPVEDDFQLFLLSCTDTSILFRETSKCGAVASLAVSAASTVFNINPTIPLTCTAIFGAFWLLGRTCAQKLEPQAKDMIQYFQDMKDNKYAVNQADAMKMGLISLSLPIQGHK